MNAALSWHTTAAGLLVAVNLVVAAWGLWRWARPGGEGGSKSDRIFTQVLALSHTLILLVGVLGIATMVGDQRPEDPLHSRVYGPFMLIAVIAAYGFRTADVRRNTLVFALAALVVSALGVRAMQTG